MDQPGGGGSGGGPGESTGGGAGLHFAASLRSSTSSGLAASLLRPPPRQEPPTVGSNAALPQEQQTATHTLLAGITTAADPTSTRPLFGRSGAVSTGADKGGSSSIFHLSGEEGDEEEQAEAAAFAATSSRLQSLIASKERELHDINQFRIDTLEQVGGWACLAFFWLCLCLCMWSQPHDPPLDQPINRSDGQTNVRTPNRCCGTGTVRRRRPRPSCGG